MTAITKPRAIREADEITHRIGQRTYHYMRHHGDDITLMHAATEGQLAEIRAAENVTAALRRLTIREVRRECDA